MLQQQRTMERGQRAPLHGVFVPLFALAFLVVSCQNAYNPSMRNPGRELSAQGHTQEAQRLLREKEIEAAMKEFQIALDMDPALGNARLGYAKASFDLYQLSQARLVQWFASDTGVQDTFSLKVIDSLFNWAWGIVDSIYAPVHMAVVVMNPMYEEGWQASDDFDPLWVGTDYTILLTSHALLGLLDFNNDGHINDEDNPFKDVRIEWTGDSLIVEGLEEVLNNPEWKQQWIEKASQSVDEIHTAARVFAETFEDTTIYRQVDSLFVLVEDALEEYVVEPGEEGVLQ